MSDTATNVTALVPRKSIISAMADRYGMDPKPFELMMRSVAMPKEASNEEFMACLMVAHEHGLNPITKEIYFMRTKAGQIQPIVSVDGWVKKGNEHPQFDGYEFEDTLDDKGKVTAITIKVFRKDRTRPTIVTEYMDECKGTSAPWIKTPTRMLRHRTLTQGYRYAFGFAGIMDHDEFEQWQEGRREPRDITPAVSRVSGVSPVSPPSPPRAPESASEASKNTIIAQETLETAETAETLEPTAAELLADLDDQCAVAGSQEILDEVWIRFDAETDQWPLADKAKAADIYEKHENRLKG